jgi:hypothetical protein
MLRIEHNTKCALRLTVAGNIVVMAIFFLGATTLVSAKSKLVMGWKNPSYTGRNKFHRVLALGMSDRTEVRADFEDALAAQLAETGAETIAGNTILLRPEGAQVNLGYIRTQVNENKVDAVVVSRLIKVEKSVTYIPGGPYVSPFPYYNTFYGYYGAVYPVVYSPDYLREDKKVRIETNLYAVSSGEGELVWTGITDTFNPSNVHKAIKGLVKLVVKQMQEEGAL